MTLITPPQLATLSKAASPAPKKMPRLGWLEWIVISQTVLPAMMFIPGMVPLRIVTRVMAFLLPLIAWALVTISGRRPPGGRRSATSGWLLFCAVWLVLSIAHPNTNSLAAGLAEAALNIAIFCPMFWAPALVKDTRQIQRLILIMLVCNGANTLMGLAQVYRPDTFRPPYIPILAANPDLEPDLSITTDDGRKILRPPGLSDSPGAAGMAGLLTCLTGMAFALRPIGWAKRLVVLGLAMIGMMMIFYSQARFLIIVLLLGGACWVALLAMRREAKTLSLLGTYTMILAFGATAWAFRSGGSAVMDRFVLLLDDRVDTVYYNNRGHFVERALTETLISYPLGAGMGRFGVMNGTFGDPLAPPSRAMMWAETQIDAWVIDGGLPLLLACGGAVLGALFGAIRISLRCPDRELGYWTIVVVVFGLFNVLSCMANIPFVSPNGLQFWILMGAMSGANALAIEAARRRVTAAPSPSPSRAGRA